MSGLFGGAPSKPRVQKATPIQAVEQTEDEKAALMKQLAKRRRATMVSQISNQPNIFRQKLGAQAIV